MLAKYDLLDSQIQREMEHYRLNFGDAAPIKLGDHLYYRNVTNPADSLTLYRFPANELQRYGIKDGEMPFLREPVDSEDEEAMEIFREREKDWPEEVVFSFGDLIDYYRENAV